MLPISTMKPKILKHIKKNRGEKNQMIICFYIFTELINSKTMHITEEQVLERF